MRLHYRTCRKYIEEFGPISEPTVPLPSQTPNLPQSSVFIPNISIPPPSNRYVNTLKLRRHVTDMLILPQEEWKVQTPFTPDVNMRSGRKRTVQSSPQVWPGVQFLDSPIKIKGLKLFMSEETGHDMKSVKHYRSAVRTWDGPPWLYGGYLIYHYWVQVHQMFPDNNRFCVQSTFHVG